MKKLSIHEIQSMQLSLIKTIDSISEKYGIDYYLISGSCLGAIRHGGFIPWDDDIDIALMRDDYERFLLALKKELNADRYFLQNEDTEKEFTLPLSRIVLNKTYQDIPLRKHLHINHGMFLDIFPLDNVPDKESSRKKQERRIKRITKIINLKVYSKSVEGYKNLVKKVISIFLLPIPLRFLKERRRKLFMLYDNQSTDCVCSMASKYGYRKHIMPRNIYGIPQRIEFEGVLLPFPEKANEHLIHLFGPNYMELPSIEKRPNCPSVYLM